MNETTYIPEPYLGLGAAIDMLAAARGEDAIDRVISEIARRTCSHWRMGDMVFVVQEAKRQRDYRDNIMPDTTGAERV